MIGRTISHYKILEELGRGGMGVVYKARDTKLDRTVVLKFLPSDLTRDEEAKARFVQEAKAAAAPNHPRIVTIYEIGEHEGQTFISMEFVEGESVRDLIDRGPLPLEKALDIVCQVADGLGKAHQAEIVHRDVKPENLLIDRDGRVRILDFGLAKLRGVTKLTTEASTLGTIQYMSPEQARGEDVDHRTDIWSIGVVLFEMITGQRPFKGDYEQAVIYSILNENPEPVTGLRTGVPLELERIILKALGKETGKRYRDADDLLVDLRNLRSEPAPASIRQRSARKRRPILLAAGLALVVAVVILLGIRIQIGRQAPAVAQENTLAVMYFDNLADPADSQKLGEIVANLLITDLSESRYVRVVSSQRLYDILKRLGREGVKAVDRDVASRVAAEARARWMLLGSILQMEPQTVMTSQLVDVETGEVHASQRIEGAPGERIFSLVDRLTVEVKRDLSLPVAAQAEPDRPVAEVTTHSPEAYRHYLDGVDFFYKVYWSEAQNSLKEALALDSTFAMANLRLGFIETVYGTSPAQGRARISRAVEYSDRVSERERLFIHGVAGFIQGDYPRAVGELRQISERYPSDKEAFFWLGVLYLLYTGQPGEGVHAFTRAIEIDPLYEEAYNMLAYAYEKLGDPEKSIWAINQYISMAPEEPNPYDTRGDLYAYSGRIDQAIESYQTALKKKSDFYGALGKLGKMYLLKGLYSEAELCYRRMVSSSDPQARSNGRRWLARIPMIQGRWEQALQILDDGIAADRMEEYTARSAEKHLAKAMIQWEKGLFDPALNELETGMRTLKEGAPEDLAVWWQHRSCVLAARGGIPAAEEELESMRAALGASPARLLRHYWWGLGTVALMKGAPDSATAYLERGTALPSRESTPLDVRCRLAEALLAAGRPGDAVDQLESTLSRYDYAGIAWPIWWVKAHYLLGRAYERSGWKAEAVEKYTEFLSLWKDADPGIAEVEDAKNRLEGLRSEATG